MRLNGKRVSDGLNVFRMDAIVVTQVRGDARPMRASGRNALPEAFHAQWPHIGAVIRSKSFWVRTFVSFLDLSISHYA
jgi:hypothetical protein